MVAVVPMAMAMAACAGTPAPAATGWSWKSFRYFRDAKFNKDSSHKLIPEVRVRFDQPSVWMKMGMAIRAARTAPHNNGLRDSTEPLRGPRGCVMGKFNEKTDIDSESCIEAGKHYQGLDVEFVVLAYKESSGPAAVPVYDGDRLVEQTKDYALLFRKRGVPFKTDGTGSGFFWDHRPEFHENVAKVGDFSQYDRLKIYTCVHGKPQPAPDRDAYQGIGLQFCIWEDGHQAETCTSPIQEQPYVPGPCGRLMP
jgi:hypothetical protein